MKQWPLIFWLGIREPFRNRNYRALFLAVFLALFTLFVSIPIWTIPGNTLAIQLDILTMHNHAVIVLLSSLSSLFIVLQVYTMRNRKKPEGIRVTTAGGVGTLFAGVFSTTFCASCYAPIFAFFGIGFGGMIFMFTYRFYFIVGTALLMLVAIYLTARMISRVCTSC